MNRVRGCVIAILEEMTDYGAELYEPHENYADEIIKVVTHEILKEIGLLIQTEVDKVAILEPMPLSNDTEKARRDALLNVARYINEKYRKEEE